MVKALATVAVLVASCGGDDVDPSDPYAQVECVSPDGHSGTQCDQACKTTPFSYTQAYKDMEPRCDVSDGPDGATTCFHEFEANFAGAWGCCLPSDQVDTYARRWHPCE